MKAIAVVIVVASVALALVATGFAWLNLGTSSPVEKSLGGRLRDEVELDSVRAHLLDAVNTTIHPAHASVWLRGAGR